MPYYITSKIIEKLLTADNKPQVSDFTCPKVASGWQQKPGDMSILAVGAQIYAEISLGEIVDREFFTPPQGWLSSSCTTDASK